MNEYVDMMWINYEIKLLERGSSKVVISLFVIKSSGCMWHVSNACSFLQYLTELFSFLLVLF